MRALIETIKKLPLLPHLPEILLGALIAIFYLLFLAHRIDLTIADLGRHLQNGRILWERGLIPATNFYSSTAPDLPVVNHHWASGFLFFLAWKAGGFAAVHLLFIVISVATFAIFFSIASAAAGPGTAALVSVLTLPLLAERTEIRPEAFSYLFIAVFFLLLLRNLETGFPSGLGNPVSKSGRLLMILPLLEILWVNTHIYFFLGPVLIAIFLVARLCSRPLDRDGIKALAYTLLAAIAATAINPFGVSGALAPLTIFQNYGYRIAENQPVWFVETLMQNPNFTIFKVLFILLAASFAARRWRAKDRSAGAALALIGMMVSAMAWLATRNFALFGFFFLPLTAANVATRWQSWLAARRAAIAVSSGILILLLITPALFGQWQRYFPYWKEFGLGLERGNGGAAEFFLAHDIRGPVFNNYDIGGYLIWHLFPRERVFVDNRPEAYPEEFFRETYIPMQEQRAVWQKELARRQFNAIFFSHRDMTPWAQQFLIARVQDPEWAPVYADRYAVIFLKRNAANAPIIERFEIPQSAFRVVKR